MASQIIDFVREGVVHQPQDSGMGHVHRPFGMASARGNLATLETLYDFFLDVVPDPDSALAQNPDYYEAIRQQPDVHAAMRKRELAVASMPWRIEPASGPGIDAELAKKLAAYVQDVYNGLDDLEEMWRQHQSAVLYGGRGFEFGWAKNHTTQTERPVSWRPIDKSRFVFDRLGNMALLTRESPAWGVYTGGNAERPIEPPRLSNGNYAVPGVAGKFLYHRYMVEPGQWYTPQSEGYLYWGRGEGCYLFLVFTFSHFVMRFRMKWLERFGIPLTVLYHPDNDATARQQVLRICESIRGESIVRLPFIPNQNGNVNNRYKLEVVPPPTVSYDAFANFDESWTRPAVQKILLGGADQMQLGDRGGYSADVSQKEAGPDILFRYDAKRIASTHNRKFIPVILAYSPFWQVPPSHHPKLILEPKEQKDVAGVLDAAEKASRLVSVPESYVYEQAGIPRPKVVNELTGETEPTIKPQGSGDPMDALFGGMPPGGGPPAPGQPKKATPIGQGKEPAGVANEPRFERAE